MPTNLNRRKWLSTLLFIPVAANAQMDETGDSIDLDSNAPKSGSIMDKIDALFQVGRLNSETLLLHNNILRDLKGRIEALEKRSNGKYRS